MRTYLILLLVISSGFTIGLLVNLPARAASISCTSAIVQADSTAPVKPTVVKKQKPDTVAVMSLVLAILSIVNVNLLLILSPVAFVLGVVAIVRIGRSKGKRKGLLLAVLGTVLSGLLIALIIGFFTSFRKRGN